jgi:hypothetical protein
MLPVVLATSHGLPVGEPLPTNPGWDSQKCFDAVRIVKSSLARYPERIGLSNRSSDKQTAAGRAPFKRPTLGPSKEGRIGRRRRPRSRPTKDGGRPSTIQETHPRPLQGGENWKTATNKVVPYKRRRQAEHHSLNTTHPPPLQGGENWKTATNKVAPYKRRRQAEHHSLNTTHPRPLQGGENWKTATTKVAPYNRRRPSDYHSRDPPPAPPRRGELEDGDDQGRVLQKTAAGRAPFIKYDPPPTPPRRGEL